MSTVDSTADSVIQPLPRAGMASTVLENGQPFRLVRGLKCDCGSTLHSYDAEALDAVAMRLVCSTCGADVIEYGRVR